MVLDYFSQVDYMNFQIPGNMNVKIFPCISTIFIIPSIISNEILMLILECNKSRLRNLKKSTFDDV